MTDTPHKRPSWIAQRRFLFAWRLARRLHRAHTVESYCHPLHYHGGWWKVLRIIGGRHG